MSTGSIEGRPKWGVVGRQLGVNPRKVQHRSDLASTMVELALPRRGKKRIEQLALIPVFKPSHHRLPPAAITSSPVESRFADCSKPTSSATKIGKNLKPRLPTMLRHAGWIHLCRPGDLSQAVCARSAARGGAGNSWRRLSGVGQRLCEMGTALSRPACSITSALSDRQSRLGRVPSDEGSARPHAGRARP